METRIWIYGYMDIWICGYMNTWIYGYMDTWMYISMLGSNLGGEGRRSPPPRPPLTRIFMRGQAPQTPHRFDGYTLLPWIPWLIRAIMQYQNKRWRSTCENAVSKRTLAINVRECSIKKKPWRSTCENACIRQPRRH